MCQIMFSVFAVRVFNGWGQCQGPFLPFPTAPGQLLPVGLCAWHVRPCAWLIGLLGRASSRAVELLPRIVTCELSRAVFPPPPWGWVLATPPPPPWHSGCQVERISVAGHERLCGPSIPCTNQHTTTTRSLAMTPNTPYDAPHRRINPSYPTQRPTPTPHTSALGHTRVAG